MGPYFTFAHVGSFIVSQWRYARRRHSSSHSGSFFFWEIRRTMSSLRPFGTISSSMSATNPALYSRVASSCWIAAFETMSDSLREGLGTHEASGPPRHPNEYNRVINTLCLALSESTMSHWGGTIPDRTAMRFLAHLPQWRGDEKRLATAR